MLRPANEILFFQANNVSKASFFNGSYNTLELDFDPLINGYSFFKWMVVPKWMDEAHPDFRNITEKNFLAGFSLNNIELETTTITHGFAGNEYNVAINSKKGNTDFSITHREFSGSPMRVMYQYWITGIRDPETGIATYPRLHNTDYAAKNHTGEIIYIVTRPDANNVASDRQNIEYSCYYTAVMPTTIQLSQFAFTHGSHDATEYEQSFRGVFHQSPKVDQLAVEILKEKVYGFMEMGEFDPTNPEAGKANNGADFFSNHTTEIMNSPNQDVIDGTQGRPTHTGRSISVNPGSPDSSFSGSVGGD